MPEDLDQDNPMPDAAVCAWLRTAGHGGPGVAVDGAIEPLSGGHWSRARMFGSGGRRLVLKLSPRRDNLRADVRAAQWRTAALPVPEVVRHGEAFGLGWVIMSHCPGTALELCTADEWRTVVPSVVDVLEALRLIDVSDTTGWGDWDPEGNGRRASWQEYLAAAVDPPVERIGEWLPYLRTHPRAWRGDEEGARQLLGADTSTVVRSVGALRSVVSQCACGWCGGDRRVRLGLCAV